MRKAVYVRGRALRVRAHTTTRNLGTGWHSTACPVRGMDGADALDRVLRSQEEVVVRADHEVTAAEAALARAKAHAVKARARRDGYASQVAVLKALAAGKGVRDGG